MSGTVTSRHCGLADYFDDRNKAVQRHWTFVRWPHLLVEPLSSCDYRGFAMAWIVVSGQTTHVGVLGVTVGVLGVTACIRVTWTIWVCLN